jgi:N utilization substance protein B
MNSSSRKQIMRAARELALNLLFQMDVARLSFEDAERAASEHAQVNPESLSLGIEFARETWAHAAEFDATATALAPDWPSERQPSVDRNILRLGLYELEYRKQTPVAVVIDESVELAKLYGTAESAKFINGVLDRAAKARTSGEQGKADDGDAA